VIRFARGLGSDESGQTLAEYALILMLVALVTIAALTTIGTTLADFLNDIATGIGGG
jgi:pilus assembly protein Flp/PilA